MTPWEIKGAELVNCTCEYGCNCQFNALPDKGHCHAVAGIQINEGHYDKTAPTSVFGVGYLLVWLGFAATAAALHWALERAGRALRNDCDVALGLIVPITTSF